jgi:hypothetical protein
MLYWGLLSMIRKTRTGFTLIISLACLLSFPCFADEIMFQNQKGLQTGVVVGEDTQSVTIRFAREAIKSIVRRGDLSSAPLSDKVIWEEGKDYLILKIPRRSIQIVPQESQAVTPPVKQEATSPGLSLTNEKPVRVEGPSEKIESAGTAQTSGSPKKMNTQQALLQEEMGRVEGVIRWHGEPLQKSKVKIVLETYTGFSLSALKELFAADKEKSPQDEIVLETTTDSEGHYAFHQAPPGYYRLYWMPDENTGWVRRLREKPDLEVITGKLTVVDVPEKKK